MCARVVGGRKAFGPPSLRFGAASEGVSKVLGVMEIFRLHQFVRSISRFFCCLLRGAERDEEAKRDAALVLRLQRAADVAEGARLAPEHDTERACVYAIEVARLSGEPLPQGGQMQVVFRRVQRGAPFPPSLRFGVASRTIYKPLPISIGILYDG